MTGGNVPVRNPVEEKAVEMLQELVVIFQKKGWLNQTLRIKHRDKKYRICCSEDKFFAYRINENSSGSWGFPGWLVCIVTEDQIIEDSGMGTFESAEPRVGDWLRGIADGDFELL